MNCSRHEPTRRPRRVAAANAADSPAAPGTRPADAAAEAVVAVVPRAMRQIRTIARSAAGGLSVPQFRALRYVDRHPGTGLTPLAEHLGVSLPAASALVGRLVASGFVERELDPAERRRITIRLTDRGRDRSAASIRAAHAWWAERLRDLTPEDREALLAGLAVLDSVLTSPAAGDAAAPTVEVA